MSNSLFRKKSIDKIIKDAEEGIGDAHSSSKLNKVLTVRDLTFMGIAAVVGAGVFSTIGKAASDGGPGISTLFIITAITCGFSALCYAEFASRVPIAGSAYTYAYVSFGELIAWIIGWALILEYAIGNIVVAISWSTYFNNLLEAIGIKLPGWLIVDPTTAEMGFKATQETIAKGGAVTNAMQSIIDAWNTAPVVGGSRIFVNIPAFIIVGLVSILTYIGIKESKKSANAMVIFKVAVIILVIIVGIFFVKPSYWSPFMPNGFEGVLKGVSAVFYAYIGFDAISTTAEECKNPQRDLPRGMIYSLLICTVLYILIALVLTGMVPFNELNVNDPLAFAFERIGQTWMENIVSISAVVATTSVLLVFQLGQPRIWMSMSRDGLLPKAFGKIHPKYHTPYFATIVTALLVAIPSLFMQSSKMTDLTSIGTLFAFVLVSGGVLTLPRIDNSINRGFKLPYINGKIIVPLLCIVFIFLFKDRIRDAYEFKIAGQKVERVKLLGGEYALAEARVENTDTSYTVNGLQVKTLDNGSSLNKLGVQINDVAVSLNDSSISNVDDLKRVVSGLKENENLYLAVVRGNKLTTLALSKGMQESLFLVFILLAVVLSIFTFTRNYSLIPILGVLSCSYLLIEIPATSWVWFFAWMGIGLTIYFLYGYRNSLLRKR